MRTLRPVRLLNSGALSDGHGFLGIPPPVKLDGDSLSLSEVGLKVSIPSQDLGKLALDPDITGWGQNEENISWYNLIDHIKKYWNGTQIVEY